MKKDLAVISVSECSPCFPLIKVLYYLALLLGF